jgi:N6-L-threonylcarbamoyladenine synthase
VGVNTAKTLAYANPPAGGKPIIPINHWLGHIYSCFADKEPEFPLLALIVSGGHTGLVYMKSHTEYEQIGATLDDAAGEAFDKVAKLLDLGYPGGPAISKIAAEGNSQRFNFPRAMLDRKDFNFSFSGLKTAVLNESKKFELDQKIKADFAASFQQCVIDILIGKTLQAVSQYKPKSVLLCGGVSANKELREQLGQAIDNFNALYFDLPPTTYHLPPILLAGDNAAMIGLAAAYQLKHGIKPLTYNQIKANSNLKLY